MKIKKNNNQRTLQGDEWNHSWLFDDTSKVPQSQSWNGSSLTLSTHELDNGMYKKGENSWQLIHSLQGAGMCSTTYHSGNKRLRAQHLKREKKGFNYLTFCKHSAIPIETELALNEPFTYSRHK